MRVIYGLAQAIIHGVLGLYNYIQSNSQDYRYDMEFRLTACTIKSTLSSTHGDQFLDGITNIFRGMIECVPVVGGAVTFSYDSLKECWNNRT